MNWLVLFDSFVAYFTLWSLSIRLESHFLPGHNCSPLRLFMTPNAVS